MDLQEVLKLLELMEAHGLDEVEVEQEGTRIRLKKSCPVIAPTPVIVQAPHVAPAPAAAAAAPVAAPVEDKSLTRILSPMVGTFYRAASPDGEPFVSVGTAVGAEQVVCIIEAMKVMNEIKADTEGEIVEVLVENGESVEYGQPLFTVRRSGAAK